MNDDLMDIYETVSIGTVILPLLLLPRCRDITCTQKNHPETDNIIPTMANHLFVFRLMANERIQNRGKKRLSE